MIATEDSLANKENAANSSKNGEIFRYFGSQIAEQRYTKRLILNLGKGRAKDIRSDDLVGNEFTSDIIDDSKILSTKIGRLGRIRAKINNVFFDTNRYWPAKKKFWSIEKSPGLEVFEVLYVFLTK